MSAPDHQTRRAAALVRVFTILADAYDAAQARMASEGATTPAQPDDAGERPTPGAGR